MGSHFLLKVILNALPTLIELLIRKILLGDIHVTERKL